ncbi:MAG: tetratricopeptide repeat protein [Planctomycetes bacterium]|nr:tetratricopeptide repeat protein [Planctomycetota bacterium]
MSASLLVEMFDRVPELQPGDDEDLWAAGVHDAMRDFRNGVRKRYTEGTLQRMLLSPDVKTRRAAALALGLLGTMDSNPIVAASLADHDFLVQKFAADALWELWFRAGTADQNWRLREATRNPDATKARAELDELIRQAPTFAEAYNQRAIWFFKRGELARAVDDCEAVLRLNPFHFGAAAGLGQCLMKLGKPRGAIRAFRTALDINPALEHLHDTILQLERSLDRSGE